MIADYAVLTGYSGDLAMFCRMCFLFANTLFHLFQVGSLVQTEQKYLHHQRKLSQVLTFFKTTFEHE